MATMLSLDNPVMANFVFYTVVVVLKMMLMSILTARIRITKGIFVTQEDVVSFYGKKSDKRPTFGREEVERVRRNHLNDLENIPAFVLIGLAYVLTGPSYTIALWHFRLFAASRFLHTLAYQLAIPQPARALGFFAGMIVTVSMAVQTLMVVM